MQRRHRNGKQRMDNESFDRSLRLKTGSDRAFGLVFVALFSLIGLASRVFFGGDLRIWALAIAGLFLAITLVVPKILHPLNRPWMRFSFTLHRVANPIVLGFIFFAVVTPIALLMRWRGKDPLRLRFDRTAKTYWIARTPPGPDRRSLKHQF
jgi:hypothetical protein